MYTKHCTVTAGIHQMVRMSEETFGEFVRQKRLAKGLSLRRFAQMVGVSPTYMSQVEQGRFSPPTPERIRRMAEILGEDADRLIALAGRVPDDLPEIIRQNTAAGMPEMLREANGLTAEEFRRLVEQIRRMKKTRKDQPRGQSQ